MNRLLAARLTIWTIGAAASIVEVRAQTFSDYCPILAANYDFVGWQAPGSTGGGTWGCQAGSSNSIFRASHDAYTVALRRTPQTANISVRLYNLVVFARDDTPEDALSLLFHWRDPVLPAGCCDQAHGSDGLRVLFSLARNQMEVYLESLGQSLGPLATLPFTLPTGSIQDVVVTYRGNILSLFHNGEPIGDLVVPSTPVGRFGFDLRRIDSVLTPILTVDCTQPGDYDCDGVPDGQDNCPGNANLDQIDLDGDGAGDACDLDDDGDGVPDLDDLCPRAADPAQADSDGDGLGDACDPCPTDASNDLDRDGICGAEDNCPGDANPDQGDIDGDGQGDRCDPNDGLILLAWADRTHLDWPYEYPFATFNLYRGDLDILRSTGVYVVDPRTPGPLDAYECNLPSTLYVDEVAPPVGKGVYYHVTGARGGIESSLGTDSAGAERPNNYACLASCDQPFTTIVSNVDGPVTPVFRVIDNLADWCAFRPSACASGAIDFTTEVAVVAAIGERYDSCNGVAVVCIRHTGLPSNIEVVTQEWHPGPGCGCLLVIVNPIHVVKIPRPVDSALFDQRSAPLICP